MRKITKILLRLAKSFLGTLLLATSLYAVMKLLIDKPTPTYWWMAIVPVVLWNCKKIFTAIHKRKWTAIAFWAGCFCWQWQVTLLFLVSLLTIKRFIDVKNLWQLGGGQKKSGILGFFEESDAMMADSLDSHTASSATVFEFNDMSHNGDSSIPTFAHDGVHDHDVHEINPATGLPMESDSIDIAGNVYGTESSDPFPS